MMRQKTIWCAVVLLAAVSAFGEAYDPVKHGNPIVVTEGAVEIDGKGAVIDGKNKVRCATLGPNVTLKNFTFKNGSADWGGGVLGGKLVRCTIADCTAALGGGAYGTSLTDCTVSGCTATESGAALGACKAVRCTLKDNEHPASAAKAAVWGGIAFDSTLTDCTFAANTVELGTSAPVFGGIGARLTLTDCTFTGNKVTGDTSVCSGVMFAYSTRDGFAQDFVDVLKQTDDPVNPDDPVTPDDPEPTNTFDGSVIRYYTMTLANGSVLTVTTAKQKVVNGIKTVAFTARLTKDGLVYSYAGGLIGGTGAVTPPTCRTDGAPKFTELFLDAETVWGKLGDEAVVATAITQELFKGEFVLRPHTARVGVAVMAEVVVNPSWGPVKYAASKLPSGLKLNAKTGEVTGVPTKAGTFLTKVTVTSTLDSKLKSVREFSFEVAAIDAWAVGTFDGGTDETFAEKGQVSLAVSKAGKISGKWLCDGQTWTVTAASYARYDSARACYAADLVYKTGSGKTLRTFTNELTVAYDKDLCAGLATNALFLAYQNNWKAEPWKSIGKKLSKAPELVFAPDGFGTNDTVSLKVAASGKVTVKGKFVKSVNTKGKVSWQSASGTAVLCPQNEPANDGSFDAVAFVYLPPKKNTPLADGFYECIRLRWNGTTSAFELVAD